jgi:hypothetical protein
MSAILKIPEKARVLLNESLARLVDEKEESGVLKVEPTQDDIILIIDFTPTFETLNTKLNIFTQTITGKIMLDNILKFFK